MSWSLDPPAVLVAMSHMSCGMGWRMKGPPVFIRMAGRPKVPVHENDPVVVVSLIWMASASPGALPPGGAQVHMRSGASMPRGHTVLS